MYITPSTEVKLLKNVPISNNYKDTLYFETYTAQNNYFLSKAVWSSSNHTYQRLSENQIKVDTPIDDIYDCNYLMFRNTSFENKWFYAFITAVEYVNNNATKITYEIDIIQTWWFKIELTPCMVIRQHAINDGIYVNCEPEDFNMKAEYVNYHTNLLSQADTNTVIITYTTGHWDSTDDKWVTYTPSTSMVEGVYCPLEVHKWESTGLWDFTRLSSYIHSIVDNGHEDDIIAVVCGPGYARGISASTPRSEDKTFAKSTLRSGAFQGYSPRNNKLYNYPFCKIVLEKPGVIQEYAYEDFRSGTGTTQLDNIVFNVNGVSVPTPALYVYPKNYRGETNNYNAGLELSDFPICPIKGDTFKMWVVQNTGNIVSNFAAGLAATAVSAISPTGDFVGTKIGIRQSIQTLGNAVGKYFEYQNKPDNVHGFQKGNIMSNINQNTVWLNGKTLDYWQARQVDTYFDMFGYKENHVMMPNIHARQNWTYIQTGGCTVLGDAPASVKAFIASRFDAGITWWADHAHVGDYTRSNPTL